MPEILYSLHEERFALVVADPDDAPEDMYYDFYFEKFNSPQLGDLRNEVMVDHWVLGEFLSIELAFPDVTVEQLTAEWELESGDKWDDSQVFRAFKIRLELFLSHDFDADFTPEEIGKSLEIDYSFGSLEQMKLASTYSCYAGSVEELDSCMERKHEGR